jgi:hypothetical protein
MGIRAPYRSHPLGIREQLAWMKREHPGFTCRVEKGLLICRGLIQPTELNEVYHVRIEYRVGDPPKAWVEEPKLRRLDPDKRIPHTYLDDDGTERPCLYLPQTGEWSWEKKLALTFIPWLSLWLFFYESWLVTGEWQGGGVDPSPREPIVERPKTWSQNR